MPNKLKYLDGLRGVAAFIVVFDHFFAFFYPAFFSTLPEAVHTGLGLERIIAKSPLNILYDGHLSVCIFFVLSGYVLTYKYFATKDDLFIASSAAKRYVRLMVPVLATMLITYLFMRFSLFKNTPAAQLTNATDFSTFFAFPASFTGMLQQALFDVFFKQQASYYVSLWTMTFELLGSFLVYALALLFGKLEKRYIFYLITAFLLRDTYYLAFILGLIVSDLFNSGYGLAEKLKKPYFVFIFGIVGLLLGSFPLIPSTDTFYKYIVIPNVDLVMTYHILGAFFIMLALMCSETLKKFFSLKPFAYLGKISFSVYLTHLTILCSLSAVLFMAFREHMKYNYATALTFIITVPTVLVISHFYAKYIDENGIKLSKLVYAKFLHRQKKVALVEKQPIVESSPAIQKIS
jgi:peptidoglycan/LPS O-acetylase OafA/YrhL